MPVCLPGLVAAAEARAAEASVAEAGAAAEVRVTSAANEGAGSLRSAIEHANRNPGTTIVLEGGEALEIFITRQLPPLRARATVLDARGATLREAAGCERPGGKKGCDGIVVTGPSVVVRDLRVAGFLFDGVAVRGRAPRDVRIQGVHAVGNLDDGIGVSEGAGPVLVEDCLLMGNGFRTKGKGLLVFDGARATLRGSTVVANRDGVTVSRRGSLSIEDTWIVGSFDKGLGVSGGQLKGRAVRILASGRGADGQEKAPNGDGLRVGLSGRASLQDCAVEGSADFGVVVLDDSTATLAGCRIAGNGGGESWVSPKARLDRR